MSREKIYTFKVEMVIQVVAGSIEEADAKAFQQGGHVSFREQTLLQTTELSDFDKS